MSRAALITLCKELGVLTYTHIQGKRVPFSPLGLRASLLERLYGAGFHWDFKSAALADAQIARGIACHSGRYGHPLAMAQHSLATAKTSLQEVRRLKGLKTANSPGTLAKVARMEGEAKQWLQKAAAYQNQYAERAGTRTGKEADYREPMQ